MSTQQMRIGDFAAAAGVSARTVRYYIVEGLLPPPEGAGLGAMYNETHLDRLRLILRLKDAYLPLREIRRQLTGLDDTGVRRRLKEMETGAAKARSRSRQPVTPDAPLSIRENSAADYLRRIADPDPDTSAQPASAAPHHGTSALSPASPDIEDEWNRWPSEPGRIPGAPGDPARPAWSLPSAPLTSDRAIPAMPAPPPGPPIPQVGQDEPTALAENWIRLRIGDDAELLVRSGAYHRLRDRVDWLVGWARTIFR